jgi:hypothetical protein
MPALSRAHAKYFFLLCSHPLNLRYIRAPIVGGSDEIHVEWQMYKIKGSAAENRVGLAKAVAGHAYGVNVETLRRPGRGTGNVSRARQVAMYLARVSLQVGPVAVARSFGRDHKAVAHACKQVEAGRQDPAFNRTIDWLETLVRRATEVPA